MSVGEIEVDLDALRREKRGEARFAQRVLYHLGPRDAPRLPLSNLQYNELIWSGGGIKQVTAWYARSLALFEYNVFDHPDFERFGSGVLASSFAPAHIIHDADLQLRFPPRVLKGLDERLIWSPPGEPLVQGETVSNWPSPNSRTLCGRRRRGSAACLTSS
jgi:hypothetical protein